MAQYSNKERFIAKILSDMPLLKSAIKYLYSLISSFIYKIKIDSYPDKSRMQHLVAYNMETDMLFPLLELYHPMKYFGKNRCDLHPRFSETGEYITLDSVHDGKRHQYIIDFKSFI